MTDNNDKYRYELKYVLNQSDLLHLMSFIYSSSAGFRKQYDDRWVNNVYFDNEVLDSAQENLSGISNRTKIRYRWYGDMTETESGLLELKLRKNQLGTKQYFPLVNIKSLEILEKNVAKALPGIKILPILQNRYLRQYFIDFSQNFRLTIDQNIYYMKIKNEFVRETKGTIKDPRVVVELKFDQKQHPLLGKVSQFFPFKLSKHSKYINGLISIGKA